MKHKKPTQPPRVGVQSQVEAPSLPRFSVPGGDDGRRGGSPGAELNRVDSLSGSAVT